MTGLVDHLFRRQAGRMVASLTRVFGPARLSLAEDVVQEAMLRALQVWPARGVPPNPEAWLMEVARNRALDALRREKMPEAKAAEIAAVLRHEPAPPMDDQLALLLLCCHPDIPHEARVALTLKTVGGFGVGEIARAFLSGETAVAQRLVRAKRRIRERGLRFDMPEPPEMAARLDPALESLYLMFNEGYAAHAGESLLRRDVCEEAIRLARLLAEHPATAAPRASALLALLLFQAARLPARLDAAGELALLDSQDRALWDRALLAQGFRWLDRAAAGEELSVWHLEAGIAAVHAAAPDFASTDWAHIRDLYAALHALKPTPVVALNRAVAVWRVQGAGAALALLAPLAADPAMRGYYLLHATEGRLREEAGDRERAAECYAAALACPCSEPERRFLARAARRVTASAEEPAGSA